MHECGSNIDKKLLHIVQQYEGTCISEGYVKHNSTSIISYSNGAVQGPNIVIDVVYEALILNPLPGFTFQCIVEFNTVAGIKGRLSHTDGVDNPFIVFLAKSQHEELGDVFTQYGKGDIILVRVKGKRFQIHDKQISIIAELVHNED
jgi:hypothetical protein